MIGPPVCPLALLPGFRQVRLIHERSPDAGARSAANGLPGRWRSIRTEIPWSLACAHPSLLASDTVAVCRPTANPLAWNKVVKMIKQSIKIQSTIRR